MALGAVAAAVEARITNLWPRVANGECVLRGLNDIDGDTPDGTKSFLEVQYPVATAAQISTGAPGANVYRDEGAFRLLLNIRVGKGVTDGLAWVDELAALFRGKVFDGVRTFAPSQPVIDDRNDDGLWFTLSFAVPYEHDTLG